MNDLRSVSLHTLTSPLKGLCRNRTTFMDFGILAKMQKKKKARTAEGATYHDGVSCPAYRLPKTALISSPHPNKILSRISGERFSRVILVIYSNCQSGCVSCTWCIPWSSLTFLGLFCHSSSRFHYVHPSVCIIW